MNETLVNIVSDQAVPNLLFIKQFRTPDSFFLFVSTVEMEEKNATTYIMEALDLPASQCRTIIIDANDAAKAKHVLIKANFSKSDKYLINLTGGNKLMSQMVFQHLQSFDARMFYSPIDSDTYQQLYPEIHQIPKDPRIVISLQEYLGSYGFDLVKNQEVKDYKPSPSTLFAQVMKTGHPGKVKEIAKATDQVYKEADKNYLMGTWFEWYLYDHFRKTLNLPASQIAFNAGIKRKDNSKPVDKDNEFDVLFIYKNDLYVFECKVYPTGKLKSDRISQPLFKLSSLTQNFGLKCKKYFAYLGEFTEDEQAVDRLENIRHNLGVERILDIETFRNSIGTDLLKANREDKLQFLIQKFQKT